MPVCETDIVLITKTTFKRINNTLLVDNALKCFICFRFNCRNIEKAHLFLDCSFLIDIIQFVSWISVLT